MPLTNLYQAVKNSVVQVLSLESPNMIHSGTGSLIDSGKYVLTCAHCISPRARTEVVAPNQPNKVVFARILFMDEDADIAILELQEVWGKPVTFANSSTCAVGNGTFAVGYPLNVSEQTLLSAYIASITPKKIRIDASINFGNSGGPLFNLRGEQIGVIDTKLVGSLSAFLKYSKSASPGAVIKIGNFDAAAAIKELIHEMQNNLNLGIGSAIPTEVIRPLHPILARCIP